MNDRDHLYVLVPCLNEEASIEPVTREVLAAAETMEVDLRLVFIDDGSTDGTRSAIEKVVARHERCEIRVNAKNLGLGRSVFDALQALPPDAWVTVFPGDNEFVFASSIENFLKARADYDLMLGYLYNPVVRSLRRRLASFAFSKMIATLYGFPWRYFNGMKMYRAWVFQGLEIVSSGHAWMPEVIAKAQLRRPDLRICEVPFYSRGRSRGASKAIRIGSILKAVFEVIRGFKAVGRYRDAITSGRSR